jgi:23S rRNA (adenine2503-C2)-methyltransferase
MQNILRFTFSELKQIFMDNHVPVSRAYQIFNWIYRKFVFDFEAMSDLPKDLRSLLKRDFFIQSLKLSEVLKEKSGETMKFLFKTEDLLYIEAVLILAEEDDETKESRMTLCVSSQAGCPLGCVFCATGQMGFKRNLSTDEIIAQILLAEKKVLDEKGNKDALAAKRSISNIVFMGMGEPLLNVESVLKAIKILNFSGGYNLGSRHFTISTAGIIQKISALREEKIQLRLAVSLHSAIQKKREILMPIASENPLPELMEAVRDYQKSLERRVTFEYVLLRGENDSEEEVEALKEITAGIDYNLNVIAYNPIPGLPYQTPTEKELQAFLTLLKKHNIPFVVRRSKGREINGGCGQLGLYWEQKKQAV